MNIRLTKDRCSFNSKVLKQLVKYFFVGGSAAIVEWSVFYLSTEKFNVHYAVATVLSFIIATLCNYFTGRKFVFTRKMIQEVKYDVLKIYFVSLCGLLINLFLMWVFVSNINLNSMLSKIIASGIAFFWNFASRQFLIYNVPKPM